MCVNVIRSPFLAWWAFFSLCVAGLYPNQGGAEPQVSLNFGGITEVYLGRREDFGTFVFDGVAVRLHDEFSRFGYDVTLGYEFEDQDTVPFYNLYYKFGDSGWRAGIGAFDRHWSPSERTSLILSRNADPFPTVYVSKTKPTRSRLPVIRALGPWEGEFFIGVTDDPTQPDNSLFFGARFAFEPTPGLEFELVRTAQFGGSGQPSGLGTFLDVLIGDTNDGSSAGPNQVAGFGVSYAPNKLGWPSRIYAQAVGEDEAGGLPSCFIYLAGIEFDTQLFGVDSTITLENVDTRVSFTGNGFCGPNTAYNNNIYPYVNDGRVIGTAIDSESESTSLYVSHDLPNMRVDWGVSHYTINDASSPSHRLSSTRTGGTILSLGASKEFGNGELSGVLVYQSFDLDQIDFKKGLRAGINFSYDF